MYGQTTQARGKAPPPLQRGTARRRPPVWSGLAGIIALALAAPALAAPSLSWETVVNNGDLLPGTDRNFNSYSPPSVNNAALVVFRARSRGGQQAGEPATGVFARDMATQAPATSIVQRNQVVPQPNNTGSTFNEFPAFARIDAGSALAATRGQSQPVWQVTDPVTGDTITRTGTAGIYATPGGGPLVTGMAGLGNLPEFPQFQVPTAATGGAAAIKFDQFPGAPAAFNGSMVAFKGNFTTASGSQTGVFYRDVTAASGATAVAWSGQAMPDNLGVFGSTAPPSAANGRIVFTGLDNEDAPTAGGIFRANVGQPGLSTLVRIGQNVPGVVNASGTTLNRIGEALSFDGRRVAFWGAWGTETRTVSLSCPGEGNAAVVAACNAQTGGTGQTTREVPLHQGILLADLETGALELVAETGGELEDFLFWTFSGRPPGVGGGDEGGEDFEEPRWRSTAFVATDNGRVAFKAVGDANPFGLYLDEGSLLDPALLLGSNSLGGLVDDEAIAASLPVTSIALERDSFRNGRLAISVSMASEEESWAGVYVTYVPEPASLLLLAGALVMLGGVRRRL